MGSGGVEQEAKASAGERWASGWLQFRDEDTRHLEIVRIRDIECFSVQGQNQVWVQLHSNRRMRMQRGSLRFDVPVAEIEKVIRKAVDGDG